MQNSIATCCRLARVCFATTTLRGRRRALRSCGYPAGGGQARVGEAAAEVGRHLDRLAAALADEEALVETFKSSNALLQNSLMYFTHVSHELNALAGSGRLTVAAETGVLANAMLRFVRNPQADLAGDVTASLDRLVRQPSGTIARERHPHARCPWTSDRGDASQSGWRIEPVACHPDDGTGTALQKAYLAHHGRAEARAYVARILLYAASVALLAYLVHLFLRLRANARALAERSNVLQSRLTFESLVTEISTHFINLPAHRVDESIHRALERLGEHTATDCAYIGFSADGTGIEATHAWCRAGILLPERLMHLPAREFPWQLERFERQDSSMCRRSLHSRPSRQSAVSRSGVCGLGSSSPSGSRTNL